MKQTAGPAWSRGFVSYSSGIAIDDMLPVKASRQNSTAIQPLRIPEKTRSAIEPKTAMQTVPAARQKMRRRFPARRLSTAKRTPETAEIAPISDRTHAASGDENPQKSSRNFLPITVWMQ